MITDVILKKVQCDGCGEKLMVEFAGPFVRVAFFDHELWDVLHAQKWSEGSDGQHLCLTCIAQARKRHKLTHIEQPKQW